jgi:diketogulonate reductase-like aldo/keto reductase
VSLSCFNLIAASLVVKEKRATSPKSTKAHRLKENADIFDFSLSDEEMKRLSDLNENKRIGPDPDNFDF